MTQNILVELPRGCFWDSGQASAVSCQIFGSRRDRHGATESVSRTAHRQSRGWVGGWVARLRQSGYRSWIRQVQARDWRAGWKASVS